MAIAEDLENETTNADEKAPFLQTTEDRVRAKIEANKLKLPDELLKFIEQSEQGKNKE